MATTGRRSTAANRQSTTSTIPAPIVHKGALAVTADWHLPLSDYDFIEQFLAHARDCGIRTLGIAGDYFHGDALSRFEPKQKDADLETELREANAMMARLLEQFERVILSRGNHSERYLKALRYKVGFETAVKMALHELDAEQLKRLSVTPLDYFWVETGRGRTLRRWYCGHPQSYNRVPLSNAIKIAAKVDASVLVGHSHHLAAGYAANGRHVVAELGGFHAPEHTEYLATTNTYPSHVNGYAFITPRVSWRYTAGTWRRSCARVLN
jgi:hypothetical protein